jgi:SAM-dependent methyltransferase
MASVEKGWLPDGLPFAQDRFDLIAAFDVLEHIDDDGEALRALHNRLTPHGLLVLTVPAFGWLWSRHDEFSHHKRRYTRAGLTALLTERGFAIVYSSYFNTFLFPVALTRLKLGALLHVTPSRAMRIPPAPLNRALTAIFSLERALIPRLSFPYGVSILLCARPQ